jgi:hypothetical protein
MSQNKRLERILIKYGLLKDGKLVKNSGLNENQKYEITDVLNYILGIRDKKDGVRNLYPFGKEDGKPYKKIEEFEKEIGIDDSWYKYKYSASEYFTVFVINENMLNNQNNNIEEVKGYEYIISGLDGYNFQENSVKEYYGKYPVKISKNNISVYNENKEELIKIEISEILKGILNKPEIQQRINKPKEEIKDSVVPENILEFIGENEKVKYRIKMKQISVRGEENKKAEITNYYYNFYYSVKK